MSDSPRNDNSQLTLVLAIGLVITIAIGAAAAYGAFQVGYGQAEAEAASQLVAQAKEIDALKAEVARAKSSSKSRGGKSAPPPVSTSSLGAAELGNASLSQLPTDQQQLALGVLNKIVGPCDPCVDAGLSLATCAATKGNICQNMDGLVGRAARLAGEGKDAAAIEAALTYGAGWARVNLTGSPLKGASDAPIVIVEYSEYQCPFCKRAQATMHELEEKYGDKVSFSFKHYPLAKHTQAKPAAKASIAAERQGKFWEYKHALFEHQRELKNEGIYEQIAEELGLDITRFRADLADPAIEDQIKADVAQAKLLGVTGTPCFFVNGYKLKGAKPLEAFVDVIDRELADR